MLPKSVGPAFDISNWKFQSIRLIWTSYRGHSCWTAHIGAVVYLHVDINNVLTTASLFSNQLLNTCWYISVCYMLLKNEIENIPEVEIAHVVRPKVQFEDPCFLFPNEVLAFEFDSPKTICLFEHLPIWACLPFDV